ncbi:hypothetical protein OsJ_29921 [Oryza sativa Japonica Group]|uniref:At1g61320/AtMIF1 LRR domain-containing protein n=1 Tax=Oryza sativa subsp. japonica TaxID=39947 RepID=A3C0D9_ORYSJ|nr:hypothetical protein OsJ_29921 [Oryza sativa Japonica Group]
MASFPTTDGLTESVAKRKGSPCQQDDDCQDDKRIRSGADLLEDIFWYIHSLMPLRDAARAACVSHSFLRSWRCYPYLMFSEELLRLQESAFSDDERTRNLISKVNHILQNHSGIGVKKLELVFLDSTDVDLSYIDSWLHKAVTRGIEELTLILPINSNAEYSFPCSLLSDGNDHSSILCYALTNLLSIVPNVEKLRISSQTQIVSTQTVPGKYLRLKHLHISLNRSPNFDYLSLVSFLDASPSLETFILHIWDIYIPLGHMGHPWTLGDSEQLRQMPGHRHDSLKKFEVVGSCYAKGLVELTCHILETTSSLDRIKLDTCGYVGLCASGSGRCYPHYTEQIMEACNSVLAIRTYIMGKVPPTVKFELVEPCSRCPVQ